MSAYTKGPWRVGDAGCTVFGPPNGKPAPEVIASITNRPIPSEKQRANARLIAAAPDLLEACKCAQALVLDGDAEPQDADRVASILYLAIKKAEGGK